MVNLRNDSSIIFVNQQSKNELTNPSKTKERVSSDTDVKVIVEPQRKKGTEKYEERVKKNKKQLEKRLGGGKVLAEDDYIKPEDFIDHEKRRDLQHRGDKNAALAMRKASDPGKRSISPQ